VTRRLAAYADAAPPTVALDWAARSVANGARIVGSRPLSGGRSHANHLLTVALPGGSRVRFVLRRWARPGWDVDDPDMNAARELSVLERLERAGVDAPRVVAADPGAVETDVPALLLTLVPGRRVVRPRDLGRFARGLAEPLAKIHAVPVDAAVDGIGIPYRRFHDPAELAIPSWSRRLDLWERAIELGRQAVPGAPGGFIHRDYHHGNVLWARRSSEPPPGKVSGVVDWTSASYGPFAIDLGHMRWNLAASYGRHVADDFLAAATALGLAADYAPEWDIRTTLDVLPELRPGADPMAELLRIEDHVARALAELG
jgi:aminoglycoside phosphotransferase (APT) family kinase protein